MKKYAVNSYLTQGQRSGAENRRRQLLQRRNAKRVSGHSQESKLFKHQ